MTFGVFVKKVRIEPHPNADKLEIARIGDYKSCVPKGEYEQDELVAYIPEASVVPLWVQKELGLVGRLVGPKKDRVHAVRLRGVLSQGLIYPAKAWWTEGQDVSTDLCIKKWNPPVPLCLAGECISKGYEYRFGYKIENIKSHPNIIQPQIEVVFTEKIHGTHALFGVQRTPEGELVLMVASKGNAGNSLYFDMDSEKNASNSYCKMARKLNLPDILAEFVPNSGDEIWIRGELYGKGIQDLPYGTKNDGHMFRIFDAFFGTPNSGYYFSHAELQDFCDKLDIPRTPVLYVGKFSRVVLEHYTNGTETVSGKSLHIREGIVVRPTVERYNDDLPGSRVQLKSVSADYLTRKNGTEYT